VLELAKRFPTDGSEKDRIYGFSTQSHSSVFDMVWTISRTNGLRILNPDATQVTLARDGWKRVLQTVVDAVKSKAVLIPDPQNPGNAMTMEDSPTGWSILRATSSARYRRS
jgi:multiple sugar transport system substrate-binding protein